MIRTFFSRRAKSQPEKSQFVNPLVALVCVLSKSFPFLLSSFLIPFRSIFQGDPLEKADLMETLNIKRIWIPSIHCDLKYVDFGFSSEQLNKGVKVRDVMFQLARTQFRFELESEMGDYRDQNPTSMSWLVTADQSFFEANPFIDCTFSINSGIHDGCSRMFQYSVYDDEMRLVPNDSLEVPFGHPDSPTLDDGYSIHWDVVSVAIHANQP